MTRTCDLCGRRAMTILVDKNGVPVRRLYLTGGGGGIDPSVLNTDQVFQVQERFCRVHRRKMLRQMKRDEFLQTVERRPYFRKSMTDGWPEVEGKPNG